MPALIKVMETGKIIQHFYMQNNQLEQFYVKTQSTCGQFHILDKLYFSWSFVNPLFYGKLYIVNLCHIWTDAKSPFCLPSILPLKCKVEPCCVEAQGPPLSTVVSFVRIDPGDWKLPQDSLRVLGSAFSVSSYILVLRNKTHSAKIIATMKMGLLRQIH